MIYIIVWFLKLGIFMQLEKIQRWELGEKTAKENL